MGVYADCIFPWLLDRADPAALQSLRREVLRDVSGRILEIGFGTGVSLPGYPPHVRRLVAIEPAASMARFSAPRIAAWGGSVEMHPLAGERLPFADAEFDSAVTLLTLCSVSDPVMVAGELCRVLRPGGALHFIEHVAASSPRAARWQRRLDPLQRVVACGCNLTRDTEATLAGVGFRFERIERGPLPGDPPLMKHLFPTIWGKAVRQ